MASLPIQQRWAFIPISQSRCPSKKFSPLLFLALSLIMSLEFLLAPLSTAQTSFRVGLSNEKIEKELEVNLWTSDEILNEINHLRRNPKGYATWLETFRSHYDGKALRYPGESGLRTVEGVKALDQAIKTLSSQAPLPEITLAPGLVQSTQDHLQHLIAQNHLSLKGKSNTNPIQRAEQYGSLNDGKLTQLLRQGLTQPKAIAAYLFIDDGNPNRSIQKALLNPKIQVLGAACGQTRGDRPLCVIDLATSFTTSSLVSSEDQDLRIKRSPSNNTWSGELSKLDFAALESDIIAETNLMRSDPVAYAKKLENLRQYYDGNRIKIPGHPIVEVVEGISALDEAIKALNKQKPLSRLEQRLGLSKGAKDHANDLGENNIAGHYGSDRSDPFTRISRYGSWDGADGNIAGENISYGPPTLAEWHIIQLLIDDDVPNRSHRKVLFNTEYQHTGSACAPHPAFRIVCVMTYATDFQEE